MPVSVRELTSRTGSTGLRPGSRPLLLDSPEHQHGILDGFCDGYLYDFELLETFSPFYLDVDGKDCNLRLADLLLTQLVLYPIAPWVSTLIWCPKDFAAFFNCSAAM